MGMLPSFTSRLWVFLAFFFAAPLAVLTASEGAFLSLQRRIVDIYEQNHAAVVRVFAAFDAEGSGSRRMLFVGTGFYISKEGHILTNTNITFGADRVWVEKDGIAYAAEVIGQDPLTNISVIRTLTLPPNFKFLRLSESPDPPGVGSFVIALTCELGMEPGPSMGLVKGWNTSYGDRILPTIFLRTSIPSEGGEGGSPVFDLNGALIGMIVAALPEVRSSFVLPSRAIQRIRDDILFSREVSYAFFGMQTREISDLERGPRVIIENVQEGGPAEAAGLKAGDQLLRMGDFVINRDADLRMASFFAHPDEFIAVLVLRDGEEREVALRAGKRETPITATTPLQAAEAGVPKLGVPPSDEGAHEPQGASTEALSEEAKESQSDKTESDQ